MGNRTSTTSEKTPGESLNKVTKEECNICKELHPSDKLTKYFILTRNNALCEVCGITQHLFNYEMLSNTSTDSSGKEIYKTIQCEYCQATRKCRAAVTGCELKICFSCYSHYMSDNETILCMKEQKNSCKMKDCGRYLKGNKGKVHYVDPNDRYVCLKCFVLHGGTNKQINKAIDETQSTKDSNFIILQATSTNDKSVFTKYHTHWSCVKYNCKHPSCIYCQGKHLFLCKVKIYDDRVDMCSDCWQNFNKYQ